MGGTKERKMGLNLHGLLLTYSGAGTRIGYPGVQAGLLWTQEMKHSVGM